MATKTQIKEILKELNMTEEQMDAHWQENIDFGYNKTILALKNSGLDWKALNPSVIKQIPFQLEKDKRSKEIAETVAKIKATEKKEKEKSAKEKLLEGKILSEREIQDLINEFEIETIKGDDNRWTRNMETIIQINDKFFSIYWQEGLTEMQPNEYLDQPRQVKKHTYQKMITVTEWIDI